MRRLGWASLVVSLACSSLARAHGGLPVSNGILRRGASQTMYVPVVYWGIWVGQDHGPWHWICEEKINLNRNRRFALSAAGDFFATDVQGLTVSNDQGCTWLPYQGGDLASLHVTDLAVDPNDGATVYATTGSGGVTTDGGVQPSHNGLLCRTTTGPPSTGSDRWSRTASCRASAWPVPRRST